MKAILLFIGSVFIWSGSAYGQDDISEVGSFDIWGESANSGETNRFNSHREAERNFRSCEKTVLELTAYSASQVQLVKDLSASLNACLDVAPPDFSGCEDFVDGTNGAVWKPDRESGSGAVFLLPADYCVPGQTKTSRLSNVRIVDKATGEIATTKHGLRHCNTANQNRLHWNVDLPPSALAFYDSTIGEGRDERPNPTGKKGFIIEFTVDGVRQECREVPNPSQRYD